MRVSAAVCTRLVLFLLGAWGEAKVCAAGGWVYGEGRRAPRRGVDSVWARAGMCVPEGVCEGVSQWTFFWGVRRWVGVPLWIFWGTFGVVGVEGGLLVVAVGVVGSDSSGMVSVLVFGSESESWRAARRRERPEGWNGDLWICGPP